MKNHIKPCKELKLGITTVPKETTLTFAKKTPYRVPFKFFGCADFGAMSEKSNSVKGGADNKHSWKSPCWC